MICTTAKLSKSMAEVAGKHRSSIRPNEHQMNVHPLVETSVHNVHRDSKLVEKRTKYFLDKTGEIGIIVGRQVAGNADKCFGSGRSIGLIADSINVLGGSIIAAHIIWIAIGSALKTLCGNVADELVDTIQTNHYVRYGDQASVVAHEAFYATGHTSMAAFHISKLLPYSLFVRIAKRASKQLIKDLRRKQSEESTNCSGESDE